jgi:MFS family permease
MIFVGILFGAFLTGKYLDTLGRKALGVYLRGLLGLLAAISSILSALLISVEFFAFSHFLTGICVSLKIVLVVYLSECASDSSRGILRDKTHRYIKELFVCALVLEPQ